VKSAIDHSASEASLNAQEEIAVLLKCPTYRKQHSQPRNPTGSKFP